MTNKKAGRNQVSASLLLQFAVVDCSGEGEDIADIADAGQIHDAALKAQTETCVTGRAVFPQIHVEVVVFGVHAQLLNTGFHV